MADEEIRRIPGLDNGVLRLPAIPFGKHGGIAAGTAGEMYMHRRIQLALAAGVVSALGILVPVAAASAAPGWSIPNPFSSPSPQPPGQGGGQQNAAGQVTLSGFPAGTTIGGELGATWQSCAAADNQRTFQIREGSSLTAALIQSAAPACAVEPTQSIWLLSVNSPGKYAGAVVFTLSQSRPGGPFLLQCGPSQGAVTCQGSAEPRRIHIVPGPVPGSPPGRGNPPAGGQVTGKVTFRGFSGGKLIGGLGTVWTTCVTSNNGRPFVASPASTLDATITTGQARPCSAEASRSIWELYVNGPPAAAGAVIFTLGQSAPGRPYGMTCGDGQGRLRCVLARNGQVLVEPAS
jgi:hypothetical protein